MPVFRIPTADELADRLGGLDRLLMAKNWERAAIVWAFTTNEDRGGGNHLLRSEQVIRFPCSISEFAELGFKGLGSRNTIARYRSAWQAKIDEGVASSVEPGDEIEIDHEALGVFPPPENRYLGTGDNPRTIAIRAEAERLGVSEKTATAFAATNERAMEAAIVADDETARRVEQALGKRYAAQSAEVRAARVREALADPEVAAQVADREIVEKVARAYHDKTDFQRASADRGIAYLQQQREAERQARDYDKLVDQWSNLGSVILAAKKSGAWTPSARSEALLYFMARAFEDCSQKPPGNWDDLIQEVEAYANQEA